MARLRAEGFGIDGVRRPGNGAGRPARPGLCPHEIARISGHRQGCTLRHAMAAGDGMDNVRRTVKTRQLLLETFGREDHQWHVEVLGQRQHRRFVGLEFQAGDAGDRLRRQTRCRQGLEHQRDQLRGIATAFATGADGKDRGGASRDRPTGRCGR